MEFTVRVPDTRGVWIWFEELQGSHGLNELVFMLESCVVDNFCHIRDCT